LRRTVQLAGIGATFLLTACLAQAAPFLPPWCHSQGTQDVALSSDGKWILSADESPHSLTLFNTALETVHRYKTTTLDGKSSSRIGAVHDAPARRSFIVALPDIAELWEVSYDPKAEPIYDGLVHDYRMGEGLAQPGYFGVRRTKLNTPLTDLYFTQDYRTVIGVATPTVIATVPYAHVINLDIRREIATLPLPALPAPGADIVVTSNGTTWRAEPGARQKVATRARLERYCTP
jgi:hypothetical protein